MESKKINQLATAVNPSTSDLAIIGDPVTGVSKKITWLQVSTLIGTAANLQQVTDNGATTTNPVTIGGLTITGLSTGVLKSDSGVISSVPFGAANGVATLAGDGKVPSNQLPSYVDDVVEVANYAALPVTGETGKIYITLDNNKVYRWGGSVYVEVAANQAVWGSITGTLANQTDLQNVLNLKATDSLVVHLAGTETITGTKTFSNPSKNDGGILLQNGSSYSLSGYMNLGGMTDGLRFTSGGGISNFFTLPSSVGYTYTFPALSGTIVAISGGNSTQYIDGTGALQTFPTLLSSDNLVKLVRNQSGATMTAGTIVYISGATGNKPLITKAIATSDATSAQTFGLVQANIANNADGYVVIIGNIGDLDTSALTEGQQLYLSGTTAGAWTTTKPYAPTHLVYVGIVLRSHPNQGIIGVKIQNGYEMDELHNVDAQSPSNNDILSYNTSTSLWEHKQIATTLGFTPISLASLSATSPLIYNNGTGAFSIQVATASQNGYLSSTDWSTFNNKQAALGGTGFVKITGSTISYDNSTYYLASNPSAYITLASLSAGDGISYSNTTGVISSTITQYTDALARAAISSSATGLTYTSATGVFSLTAGYAIPTTAKQTEWDTAYTNRITSLTTTGTSGVATLVANTLNIPNYTTDLSGYVTLATSQTISANKTFSEFGFFDKGVLIKQGNYPASSGYNGIGAIGGGFYFGMGQTSVHLLSFSTSNSYNYTFPNATGTLALTSDIPSLAGYITGSGTSGRVALFSSTSAIGNSQIYDNGTTIGIGSSVTSQNKLVSVLDTNSATAYAIMAWATGVDTGGLYSNVKSGNIFNGQGEVGGISGQRIVINNAGVITLATWQGVAIADTYISSAATWNAKQAALNGTGFVKATGTTISYDNSTYLTTASAASTYVPYTGATGSVNLGSNNLLLGSGNAGGHIDLVGTTDTAYINIESAGCQVNYNSSRITTTDKQFGGTFTLDLRPSLVTGNAFIQYFQPVTGTIALTSQIPSLTGYVTGSGTENKIAKFTSTGSVIGNSLITDNGSGVSINNSTISYLFNVHQAADIWHMAIGDVSSTGQMLRIGGNALSGATKYSVIGSYLNNTGATTSLLVLQRDGGNLIVGGTATISDSGYLFQVKGNAEISNNYNGLTRLNISNTTSGAGAYVETSYITNAAGNSSIGKYSTTTTAFKIITASNAYLYNGGSGDIAILNDFATGAIKMAAGGSSTAHFTIASTGTSTFGGQVIISNSSDQPLRLANASTNQYLHINSGAYEAMTQYENPTAGSWYTGIRTSAGLGTTASYHIYSSVLAGDAFAINTSGAARFASSVTATSFVKTGGTSTEYLMADGSVSTLTGSFVTLSTTQTITGQKTISRIADTYGGTTQSFLIDGAAGNGALTINSASAYAYMGFAQAGTTKMEIGIIGTAGARYGSLYINRNAQVGEAGASIVVYKSNGYVGINNLDPAYQLDVSGTTRLSGTITANSGNNTRLFTSSATTGYQYMDMNNDSGRLVWGINGNSAGAIATNSLAYGGVIYATNTLQLGVDGVMFFTMSNTGAATFTGGITTGAITAPAISITNDTGGITMNRTGTGNYSTILYKTAGTGIWYVGMRENNGTSDYIIFNAPTGSNTFRIKNSNGFVSVGDLDPAYKFNVYTDADVWHTAFGGASGQLRIGGQTGTGAVIQSYTPAGVVRDLFIQRDGGAIVVGGDSVNSFGSAKSIQINGSGGALVETRYNGTSGLRIGSGSDHSYHHDPRNAEMRFATSDSTRFYIYGNGNYSFTGSNVSDRRAKDNISLLDITATDKIMSLEAKSYNMKNNPSQKRYGFIAQEVKQIVSDLVSGNEADGYLGLDYDGLLTLAIKALQEQQKEIQILKQK